jgi:hypothetical protein
VCFSFSPGRLEPFSLASEYATAVSTAFSKMLPLPPAIAFCCAPVKTFSKMRGTAATKVGWNIGSSSRRCCGLVAKPTRTPFSTEATWRIFAKECASGRNSSCESSGVIISWMPWMVFLLFDRRLPWVSTQPFGRPVVPDV